MNTNWTMYIYKTDRRTRTGERLVSTTVWQHRDEAEMRREVRELQYETWPVSKGYRMEFVPAMKTVINLMSGQEVEIPYHTPRSCDPSSELYWSM
jgi:hypothetical protein